MCAKDQCNATCGETEKQINERGDQVNIDDNVKMFLFAVAMSLLLTTARAGNPRKLLRWCFDTVHWAFGRLSRSGLKSVKKYCGVSS